MISYKTIQSSKFFIQACYSLPQW